MDHFLPSQLKVRGKDHGSRPPFPNRTKQKSVNILRGVEHDNEDYEL